MLKTFSQFVGILKLVAGGNYITSQVNIDI